jgi:hypothetical protein
MTGKSEKAQNEHSDIGITGMGSKERILTTQRLTISAGPLCYLVSVLIPCDAYQSGRRNTSASMTARSPRRRWTRTSVSLGG